MLTITKRYAFSAAHRLWNDQFSPEENERIFGMCIRTHGHNYVLEVTIAGEPDPETGMILNLPVLDALVRDEILTHLDHRFLEEEVAFLKGTLTTVENVVQILFQRLQPCVPVPARLHRLRLFESDYNWAEAIEGSA
jgi:6-pyruvoyltetrahydropterin/6-carboxytetrahydropterin synthase